MCRLALLNQATIKFLGADVLTAAFQELTKAMGGSGIGGACLTKKGYVHTKKGVDLTEKELAEWMVGKANREGMYFIYHTRFATTGSVCDGNCHPFTVGGLTMAHNGVASTFAGMGDKTDSEAVARILSLGYELSWLEDVSGVWVGFKDGRPFVVKGQAHSSLHLLTSGDMWMFVSQVPQVLKGLFDTDNDLAIYSYVKGVEKHFRTPVYTTKGYSKSWTAGYDDWEYSGRTYTTPKQTSTAASQETKPIRAIGPATTDTSISYFNGVKVETPKEVVWRQDTTNPNKAYRDNMCKAEIMAEHNDRSLEVRVTYTSGQTTQIKMSASVYNQLLAITDPDFLAIKDAVKDSMDADGAEYTELDIEELALLEISDIVSDASVDSKVVTAAIIDEKDEGRLLVQVRNEIAGKLEYREVTWNEYDVLVHDNNADVAKSSFVQPELVEGIV